ncbi:hypothetical protein [Nocardia sp. NPDC051981]|uniref:hypothetical protein n=1 Tax=Nocardia sp. NPDC051981 TaxID=3155417 RepID=UPI003430B729
MMRKTRFVSCVAVVAAILSGCSLIGTHAESKPACDGFDLAHSGESLGSGTRLRNELENAATRPGPVRFIDITRAAGWSDDWTRMVEVPAGTKGAELNSVAHTTESCWKGLPAVPDDDQAAVDYFLFIKDEPGANSRPVQAVQQSSGNIGRIYFHNNEPLTTESVLIAGGKALVAQP